MPEIKVSAISISDFNLALSMQGKEPITLKAGEYLLNCNYKGTFQYISEALRNHPELTIGGITLRRASEELLQETQCLVRIKCSAD